MIDTHSHIAWNIDDGFESKAESERALQLMKEDGISSIIATPHVIPAQVNADELLKIQNRIDELRDLAKSYEIVVHTGCELFLNNDYLSAIEQRHYLSLADSRYVLVEFDVRKDISKNEDAENIFHELLVRELIPIVAHAERYFPKSIDINRIREWIKMGCFIQINRTSLLGMHGAAELRNSEKLLQYGLVHVMASDAHRADGNRICKLSDAYKKVERISGVHNAELLCCINPMHIISDEELEDMQMEKKSRFLHSWRKK